MRVLFIFFLVVSTAAANAGPAVGTNWIRHSYSSQMCLDTVEAELAARGMEITRTPVSVIGELGVRTVHVQCEAPGYAFIAIATPTRADFSVSYLQSIVDGLRSRFP